MLIGGEGYDAEATLSPQGDKIVFTSTRDGDLDLFVGGSPSSDGGGNELWVNDGVGGFTAASGGPTGGSAGTQTAQFGDVDGDALGDPEDGDVLGDDDDGYLVHEQRPEKRV